MPTKRNVVLVLIIALSSFITGRYSAPDKIKIETKMVTVEVEKKSSDKTEEKEKITTQIIRPDGTQIVRTRTIHKDEQIEKVSSEKESATSVKKEISSRRGVIISVLTGAPLTSFSSGLVFGANFEKQLLGPIYIGAWGFTDKRAGVSLGLEL